MTKGLSVKGILATPSTIRAFVAGASWSLLAGGATLLTGCPKANESVAQTGATQTTTPTPAQPQTLLRPSGAPGVPATGSPCASGQNFEGHVTLRGVPHVTKGGRAMLKGTLLLFTKGNHAKHRELATKLIGNYVVVEGDLCVRYCDPNEQCLTSGKIPIMRNPKILELKAKTQPDAAVPKTSL